MIKKIYVISIKFIYFIFLKLCLINYLHTKKENVLIHWFISIFYIWNIKGLIKLDTPWWTYKAIAEIDKFIKSRKKSNINCLEYGSGASTIWLAKRVKNLISIEHSNAWATVVEKYTSNFKNINYQVISPDKKFISNQNYHSHKEKNVSFYNYVTSIKKFKKKFDIIVIDGRARPACLKVAKKYLKKNGIIVFDNCNRKQYNKIFLDNEIIVNKLSGLTPSLPYPDSTAIITLNQKNL